MNNLRVAYSPKRDRWSVIQGSIVIYYAPETAPKRTQWWLALDYANHLANLAVVKAINAAYREATKDVS
jgi:hypothetical protein